MLLTKGAIEQTTDVKDLLATYNGLNREINQIMEFARRFVTQNKDLLTDNSDFFDRSLYEKIKAMPVELLRDYLSLFTIVEQRGHSVLKEIIEKYK
jgi:hypothetical protein